MIKCCSVCGREFEAFLPTQRCCSNACRIELRRRLRTLSDYQDDLRRKILQNNLPTKICPNCKTEFKPLYAQKKFCSHACWKKFFKAKKKRNCVVCGKEIEPSSLNHKYCSDACKKIFYKDYQKNYRMLKKKLAKTQNKV